MKVMVIVAHLDDAEITTGGLTIKLVKQGHEVIYVAMSDGGMGHHFRSKEETEACRKAEALAAAKVVGAKYEFMHISECEIMPTVENRKALVAMIRKYSPDVIITHPGCDYHADHKYTSELVADAAYMLQVPKFVPESPVMRHAPYIFYAVIREVYQKGLEPAWILPIDDVFEQRMLALHCHTCQMYEWLPWASNMKVEVPEDEAGRLKFLYNWRAPHYEGIANRYRDVLVAEYGEKGKSVKYAEAFFKSPLGAESTPECIKEIFGSL